MLITLSGTMVISCLVNIVQGGGGEVLPRFGMLEKRSSVSLLLKPIVGELCNLWYFIFIKFDVLQRQHKDTKKEIAEC